MTYNTAPTEWHYKQDSHRMVMCPNGVLIASIDTDSDMHIVFQHLAEWSLPVLDGCLHQ